jgi:uncharacterized protein YhjY with autotransporter beta-barrel domain
MKKGDNGFTDNNWGGAATAGYWEFRFRAWGSACMAGYKYGEAILP